jgi:LCP family protein required for cell wall assembly
VLIGASSFIVLCLVAVAGGYGYLRWRFDQVATHRFAPGVLRNDGSDDPGQPMNVLLVGSDSRANLQGADCARSCRDEQGRLVTGQRSDTIMVLHADPRAHIGEILSIPRDLWVPIAGTTRRDRINSAFDLGPDALIRTITASLGIPIDHYVEVDFVGFRNLVNALGGVQIYVPSPARDAYSDLAIPAAGCTTLNGDQALAWVRSRHYQYFEAGRWHTDPTSDLGRIRRQQDFIRRVLKRAVAKGARNPLTLNRLIGVAVHNVTIDASLSSRDIVRLGEQFRSLDPASVQTYTLPTAPVTVGGADVLRLEQPQAQQVIGAFLDAGAPASRPGPALVPNQVRVRVLNGTGAAGLAGRVGRDLEAAGFQTAGTGDADRLPYASTVIRYGTGQQAKAQLLAGYLGGRARLVEDHTLTVDVVLTVGRDFTGVTRPAATAAQSPTTTAVTATPPAANGAPSPPQC